MEFNPALPKLGQTWFGTELATPTSPNSVPSGAEYQAVLLEGSVNKFKVPAMEYTNGMRLPISGRESLAILVRNTLGSALLPGQLVDWEALYRGRRVNVKTVTTATIAMAGIVDPFLPDAGVADDDLFWLFREGPCWCRFIDGSVSASDAVSVSATAGSVDNKGSAYAFGDVGLLMAGYTFTGSTRFGLVDLKLQSYS